MCKPCYQTTGGWHVTIVSSKGTEDENTIKDIKKLVEALILNQAKRVGEEN